MTGLQFAEMRFEDPWNFYTWRNLRGELHLRFADRPTKWTKLRKAALDGTPKLLPRILKERPEFAMLFLMVYPHRLCQSLAHFLDHELLM